MAKPRYLKLHLILFFSLLPNLRPPECWSNNPLLVLLLQERLHHIGSNGNESDVGKYILGHKTRTFNHLQHDKFNIIKIESHNISQLPYY